MTHFAKTYGQGPVSLAEVARVEHLPLAYLEQLAGQLRRAGLLESTRGVHGGYSLSRAPEAVTVFNILAIIEGEVSPVACLAQDYTGNCVRDVDCASRGLWQRIKAGIETVLRTTSLAELVGDHSLLHDLTPLPEMTPLPMAVVTPPAVQETANA